MEGIFSVVIKIYGLVKPNILICRVPVTASAKFTSMEGLVSKLSERLQQAAFNNSELLTLITLVADKKDLVDAFFLVLISTSSNCPFAVKVCFIGFVFEISSVSVL